MVSGCLECFVDSVDKSAITRKRCVSPFNILILQDYLKHKNNSADQHQDQRHQNKWRVAGFFQNSNREDTSLRIFSIEQ